MKIMIMIKFWIFYMELAPSIKLINSFMNIAIKKKLDNLIMFIQYKEWVNLLTKILLWDFIITNKPYKNPNLKKINH